MSVGELDFDMLLYVKVVGIVVIEEGKIKYILVSGIFELCEVISVKFWCENGLDYVLNVVMVMSGGKQVLFNVFFVLLNFGDEVLIFVFYWVSYFEMVVLIGVVLVIVFIMLQQGF